MSLRIAHYLSCTAVCVLFCANTSVMALDIVSRRIHIEAGNIIVEDKLSISAQFAEREPQTWNIYWRVQSGKTNLLSEIQELLNGEDLEISKYHLGYEKGQLNLDIVSKAKFSYTNTPAKLCWLPTWGGEVWDFADTKISLGRRGVEMLIFQNDGHFILWFPDLGPSDDFLGEFSMFKNLFDVVPPFDRKFLLTLTVGDKSVALFSSTPAPPNDIPNLALLTKMNGLHKISSNDLISMCTSTKIAKGGYYEIGSSKEQNK
jgi:hypothetical protein